MNLTGKCLNDFWDWYLKPENKKKYKTESLLGSNNVRKIHFIALCEAEQWGIIQDFADYSKIKLDVIQDPLQPGTFSAVVDRQVFGNLRPRSEARIKSVREFDSHYNQVKNQLIK